MADPFLNDHATHGVLFDAPCCVRGCQERAAFACETTYYRNSPCGNRWLRPRIANLFCYTHTVRWAQKRGVTIEEPVNYA